MKKTEFDEVTEFLSDEIKQILIHIPEDVKNNTYEIRLRTKKPIVLFGKFGNVFVNSASSIIHLYSSELYTVKNNAITETVKKLCEYSLYAHQEDIAQGFITFGNGHRAGFCGTAVTENGKIAAIRKIDSVNIRIARNVGFSLRTFSESLSVSGFKGVIVCGAPCSGKTTFLRCFAKECSSSFSFGYMKTVIVDERYELGTDTGMNCDVVKGFSKFNGIVHATRVLSPELIVCDEICDEKESNEILSCCRTGVRFAVSVHADSIESLFSRSVSRILLLSDFFDYVVLLRNNKVGHDFRIYKTEEIKNECFCNCIDTF